MIPKKIHSADNLITSSRAVCDGFMEQALKKSEKAQPFIERGRWLLKNLFKCQTLDELISNTNMKNELYAAIGFSDKAQTHISVQGLEDVLKDVISSIIASNPKEWREEIVFRYFLTKGDSLGGSMRNLTGILAHVKFTEFVIASLKKQKMTMNIKHSPSNPEKIQWISWKNRFLLFDKKPRLIGKNIDVILLKDMEGHGNHVDLLSDYSNYLSCGEIKGGIDPAGADEHWKTASGALERIRSRFKDHKLQLFFAGAAIERSMAQEIYSQLFDGRLAFAANLTVPEQIEDLVLWLVNL